MPPAAQQDRELFPIRTVSSLTGVNAITLRAWERRYGLVKPVRTAGGQRAYTRENIDAIHHIVAQLERGMTIGQVRLEDERQGTARGAGRAADPWQRLRAGMAAAIAQFDEDRLDDAYNDALSQYPLDVVTDKVVRPLMTHLGDRWRKTSGGIAEEHFFAVYLRNKIGARFHHRARHTAGPRLLAACLPGEYHETGLLLFALAAHERGLRVVLLGSDTPLGEIPVAVRRARCEAIVLSVTVVPRPGLLQQELPRLVAEAGVPVFVGGPCSGQAAGEISVAGAQPLGDDTRRAVMRVADTLGAPRAQRSQVRRP